MSNLKNRFVALQTCVFSLMAPEERDIENISNRCFQVHAMTHQD